MDCPGLRQGLASAWQQGAGFSTSSPAWMQPHSRRAARGSPSLRSLRHAVSSPSAKRLQPSHALLPGSGNGNGNYGSGPSDSAGRRALLLKYVNECDPNDVKQFVESAPRAVVQAMRQTVTNIVGSLPNTYFEVKVSTVADSLSQLFLTMARTGYLFASAQCRMELQAALNSSHSSDSGDEEPQPSTSAAAAPSSSSSSSQALTSGSLPSLPPLIIRTESTSSTDVDSSRSLSRRDAGEVSTSGRSTILLPGEEQYAPGVQKRNLEGEVLRWSYEKGVERLGAAEYVEHLEQQVATLKDMLLQVHEAHQHQHQQQGRLLDKSSGAKPGAGTGAASALQTPASSSALMSSMPSAATAAAAAAAAAASGSGELLEFLRGLPGDSLGELTSNMGPDVLDAMDAFVARLMGTSDKDQLRSMSSEFDAAELSKVLLWLLVVGYALRTAEMRMETLSFGGGTGGKAGVDGGSLFGYKSVPVKKGLWGGAWGGWGKLLPGNGQ